MDGPYAKLYREVGGELQVHYFHPAVLDRYKEDPNYSFYGNRFSTKEKDNLPIEPSGIQQFEWGHTADGSPCVTALLPHLITLSYKDQLHWQSRELSPEKSAGARIDSRYVGPMLYGMWPDTISRFTAVYLYLAEIQKIFEPDALFPALPDSKPDFLGPLSYNSKKAFIKFAQDLYTILDIKPSVLAPRIKSSEKDDLLKKSEKWNLVLLYFDERGQRSAPIEEAISTIKEIMKLRIKGAHTVQQAERDRNYDQIQRDLILRLQANLHSLLLAFAIAEKGSMEVISKRVLEFKVE